MTHGARLNRALAGEDYSVRENVWCRPRLLCFRVDNCNRTVTRASTCALANLVIFVFLFMLSAGTALSQESPDGSSRPTSNQTSQFDVLLQQIADVTVFVIPDSADTARVALVYNGVVPTNRVRSEINRLTEAGWVINSDLRIEDRSVRPDISDAGPVNTGAFFSISKAPQVQDNAPVLLPYLKAFQNWKHITVLFNISDIEPYNGITQFDSDAVIVRLIPQEGAYRFEALILDHKRTLGPFPVNREPKPNKTSVASTTTDGHSPGWLLPLMLGLLGVGVLGGIVVYLIVARHATIQSTSGRTR